MNDDKFLMFDILFTVLMLAFIGMTMLLNDGGIPVVDVIVSTICITAYVALKCVLDK